jgi:hypothetical protein
MNDTEYIKNYKPQRLYVNPANGKGVYATMCAEHHRDESVIEEFKLHNRTRIAVSIFFLQPNNKPSTIKITLLRFRKNSGWYEDGHITLNGFDAEILRQLLAILSNLEFGKHGKQRIDLDKFSLDDLAKLSGLQNAADFIKQLATDNRIQDDIFALGAKRTALKEFQDLMEQDAKEQSWQNFFENNTWIFGFGLNYVFLDKVGTKFEQVTTGYDYETKGKRADGLARTRAKISNFVLIEIKTAKTKLLKHNEYRPGVWQASQELSGAIAQCQKTSYEFTNKILKSDLRDNDGYSSGEVIYNIQPKSYLVAGNLGEIANHDGKITSFELLRRNTGSPEIITFDELYYRAENLVNELAKH